MIHEDVSSVFLSFIYAIDERKNDNWNEVLDLFSKRYRDNEDVITAISKIQIELDREE